MTVPSRDPNPSAHHVVLGRTQRLRGGDLVAQVEVKFDGLKPKAFEVLSVDLVEPSRGFGISTSRADECRWLGVYVFPSGSSGNRRVRE
jgi:hypothetical protein